jgi:hypothetical protein
MPSDSGATKRSRRFELSRFRVLMKIVQALGVRAPSELIREEARRQGLGEIRSGTLCRARDAIDNVRPRRQGPRKGQYVERRIEAPKAEAFACGKCQSLNTVVKTKSVRIDGTVCRRHDCNDCGSSHWTEWPDDRLLVGHQTERIRRRAADEKPCGGCGRVLPLSEFYELSRRRGDPARLDVSGSKCNYFRCRECAATTSKDQQFKCRLRRHGLTIADFDRMVRSQNGRCAICRNRASGEKGPARLVIDHSHTTGTVRELLCSKCNVGIGMFNESEVSLAAAIAYLKKHQKSSAIRPVELID